MNSLSGAFARGKAFIAFVTGGDPDLETTEKLVVALAQGGADLIEIGIPFSDPIAEGPVIQRASERALRGGCTPDKLFALVNSLRAKVAVPLVFMTYINPIFAYGKARFAARCAETGVAGLIVPDLPFEERGELSGACAEHGVALVSMIAPSSEARIDRIARGAEGFLYCVSSMGVTGVRDHLGADVGAMIRRVRAVSGIPCAVGFGIATPAQAKAMAALSDGVIVGSAIVQLVEAHGRDSAEPVRRYAAEMKAAL